MSQVSPLRLAKLGQLFVVASAVAALTPAAAAAADPKVTLSTGLAPAFSTKVNDYTTACAAGLVSVKTDVPRGLTVKVDGRAARAGVVTTKVKLRSGQRFNISVGSGSKAIVYSIRCLPTDFPRLSAQGSLPAAIPYLALSVPSLNGTKVPYPYSFVVNRSGVPIWWKRTPNQMSMNVMPAGAGRIGFWQGNLTGDAGLGAFGIYGLNGKLESSVKAVGGVDDPHEALPLPNGNWYRIAAKDQAHINLSEWSGPSDTTVIQNEIQEIDPSGKVVWSWSTADHIPYSDGAQTIWLLASFNSPAGIDLVHMNSIEDDGKGHLIVSARHLNAVYAINKADGSIAWKLGGTMTPQSLTVLGDDANALSHLAGQHDARLQPDGTVTVYDNGSGAGRAPRASRWQIDPVAQTATLVEQITDKDVRSSLAGGGARRVADGSWVVSWCSSPLVRAYSSEHSAIFTLKLAGATYRAVPFEPGQFTRQQFVAGMDAQYPR